jgi:hypothetical protein
MYYIYSDQKQFYNLKYMVKSLILYYDCYCYLFLNLQDRKIHLIIFTILKIPILKILKIFIIDFDNCYDFNYFINSNFNLDCYYLHFNIIINYYGYVDIYYCYIPIINHKIINFNQNKIDKFYFYDFYGHNYHFYI